MRVLLQMKVIHMPHFIILGNWTDQGIRNVKDASKRDSSARQMIEQAGGKMQLYYTLGDYDFVVIVDIPSDEDMLDFLLKVNSLGNVRTKTLKAWTESEATKVFTRL